VILLKRTRFLTVKEKIIPNNYSRKQQLSIWEGIVSNFTRQDAVLSQGVPCNAAVNFGMYRSFQWHRAVLTAITTLSN